MLHTTLRVVVALATLAAPAFAQPDPTAIGSLDGARVATPAERDGELVYLASAMSADDRAALRAAAPGVRIVDGLTRETVLNHAAGAHAIDAHLVTPEFLASAPNLVWVQSRSAGVDRYMSLDGLVNNDRIVLTNMRAAHGPTIADHSMAMLLSLTRGLRGYDALQREGRWLRDLPDTEPIALQGRTMLVVGFGGIGSEIGVRAHAFGMRIIATRRSAAQGPDWVERMGTADDLMAMLPEADVVALAVPLTPETEHLIDAAAFAAMKPGAYLINIARGRVVDTNAMLDALRSGRLAGAGLDVTDPEPLPAGHPLWREPNVIITPHVAGVADLTRDRAFALLRENIRRFDAGEPLLNVVDKQAGY
ncbi:MAG: D-2-hydroxyacid dehydrogenase [Phycisphaerales bacterium]